MTIPFELFNILGPASDTGKVDISPENVQKIAAEVQANPNARSDNPLSNLVYGNLNGNIGDDAKLEDVLAGKYNDGPLNAAGKLPEFRPVFNGYEMPPIDMEAGALAIQKFIAANPNVVKDGLKDLDKQGITDPEGIKNKLGEYLVNKAITTGLEKGFEGAADVAGIFGGPQARYLVENKDVLEAARKSDQNIFIFAKNHAANNGWKEGRNTYGMGDVAANQDALKNKVGSYLTALRTVGRDLTEIEKVGNIIGGGGGAPDTKYSNLKNVGTYSQTQLADFAANNGIWTQEQAQRFKNELVRPYNKGTYIPPLFGGSGRYIGGDPGPSPAEEIARMTGELRSAIHQKTQGVLREAVSAGADINDYFGDDWDSSETFRQLYGFNKESGNNNRILHNNPNARAGAYEFDPVFGTRYHRELAESLGEQVGLSPAEVRATVGQLMTDRVYKDDGAYRFLVNYEKGQTDPAEAFSGTFAKDYTNALLNASGIELPAGTKSELLSAVNGAAFNAADALFTPNKKSNGFFSNLVSNVAGGILNIGEGVLKPFGLEDYAAPIIGAGVTAFTGGGATPLLGTIGSAAVGAATAGALPGLAAGDFSQAFRDGLKGAALGAATAGLGAEFANQLPENFDFFGDGLLGDTANAGLDGVKEALKGGSGSDAFAGGLLDSVGVGGLLDDFGNVIGGQVGQVAKDALTGGIVNGVTGGSFTDGLATGGIGGLLNTTPLTDKQDTFGGGLLQESAKGGLENLLGGGQFGDGAKEGAAGFLFDEGKDALSNLQNPFANVQLPDFLKQLGGAGFDLSQLKQFLPDFNLPDFNLPEFNLPDMPGIGNPFEGVNLPDINLPDINNPFENVNLPDVNLPDINLPDVNLPDVNLPKFNMGGLLGATLIGGLLGSQQQQPQRQPQSIALPKFTFNDQMNTYTGDFATYGERPLNNFQFYQSSLLGA